MTPKDIIIGQKYKHLDNPNIVYFGVGDRDEKQKHLVVLGSPQKSNLGINVEYHGTGDNFWNNFRVLK